MLDGQERKRCHGRFVLCEFEGNGLDGYLLQIIFLKPTLCNCELHFYYVTTAYRRFPVTHSCPILVNSRCLRSTDDWTIAQGYKDHEQTPVRDHRIYPGKGKAVRYRRRYRFELILAARQRYACFDCIPLFGSARQSCLIPLQIQRGAEPYDDQPPAYRPYPIDPVLHAAAGDCLTHSWIQRAW